MFFLSIFWQVLSFGLEQLEVFAHVHPEVCILTEVLNVVFPIVGVDVKIVDGGQSEPVGAHKLDVDYGVCAHVASNSPSLLNVSVEFGRHFLGKGGGGLIASHGDIEALDVGVAAVELLELLPIALAHGLQARKPLKPRFGDRELEDFTVLFHCFLMGRLPSLVRDGEFYKHKMLFNL